MMVSRWILKMRSVADKNCTENVCLMTFFCKSCHLQDDLEKYGTATQATEDNIIWRIQTASWITKATHTHSEYITLIAFPLQQWLHECALMWSYMRITCLFIISLVQSTSRYFRKITLNTVFPFTVRSSKNPLLNRTIYMKQVPSSETVSLARQEIPCPLYKWKFHYHVQRSSSTDPDKSNPCTLILLDFINLICG